VDEYSRYHQIIASRQKIDDARISIGAKILAVADAFETLQTETPTRSAFAPWTALEEVERGAGSSFATEVVKALRRTAQSRRTDVEDEKQRYIRLA
jgi:HD-GYP domain-containing protein (c-di-GMP phosphodiesterase class II)